MKRSLFPRLILGVAFILLSLIFFPLQSSYAGGLMKAYQVRIVPGETVEGPLLVAGKDVVVDGTVNGDLWVFGSGVTINGTVNGDLLAVAAVLEIAGKIKGDVRSVCGKEKVTGKLGGGLSFLGQKLVVAPGSIVDGDLLAALIHGSLNGIIKGRVSGWGSDVTLGGKVGEGTDLFNVGRLIVDTSARINGPFRYAGVNPASVSPSAVINGEMYWKEKKPASGSPFMEVVWFLAGILIWGLVNFLFPGSWGKLISPALEKPLVAVSWGLVIFLAVPVLVVGLLFTMVGLPLAVLMAGVYAAVFYLGKIITGYTLGFVGARRVRQIRRIHGAVVFMAGYGLITVIGNLPYIDTFVAIMAPCWALGAFHLVGGRKRRQMMGANLQTRGG